MFYDKSLNILYVTSKGEIIYYFEYNGSAGNIKLINKFSLPFSIGDVAMVNKRSYDVMNCEISRFVVSTKNSIEVVSLNVPRKVPYISKNSKINH